MVPFSATRLGWLGLQIFVGTVLLGAMRVCSGSWGGEVRLVYRSLLEAVYTS